MVVWAPVYWPFGGGMWRQATTEKNHQVHRTVCRGQRKVKQPNSLIWNRFKLNILLVMNNTFYQRLGTEILHKVIEEGTQTANLCLCWQTMRTGRHPCPTTRRCSRVMYETPVDVDEACRNSAMLILVQWPYHVITTSVFIAWGTLAPKSIFSTHHWKRRAWKMKIFFKHYSSCKIRRLIQSNNI